MGGAPAPECEVPSDCASLVCDRGVCANPSCIDGVRNQGEEEVDCGGPSCPCCSPGAFAAPEKLSGFGVAGGLYGPSVSSDPTALYFAAFDTDEDIFVARRADRGTVFSAATAISQNSAALDGTPTESANGLRLYFYSERAGSLGGRDLMVATRSSLAEEFAAPVFLSTVNSQEVDQSPTVSGDELRLIFASLRPDGAGASDLWLSERATPGEEFGAPVNLTELNTAFTESGPSLARDELTLFFVSNRPDSQGHDIWMATRTERSTSFEAPTRVLELSMAAEELDTSLSADGRELVFSSNVDGEHELWRAVRECL